MHCIAHSGTAFEPLLTYKAVVSVSESWQILRESIAV